MSMKNVLAFDYGASSGRGIMGSFDGEKIAIEEIHRFSNTPVYVGKTLYWDILRLYHNLKMGLSRAFSQFQTDSIGIDTWGVDFGLLDKEGYLLENPVHYRDARTNDMPGKAYEIIPERELYDRTGIQLKSFNTLFQLLYIVNRRPDLIKRTDKILLMPDLLTYFLTGQISSEYTIATTTQCLSHKTGGWNYSLLEQLNIPGKIFPEIRDAGSPAGKIQQGICNELLIPPANVINVASHDTASAVAAVPSEGDDFVYISCGTWSLMGIESNVPYINEQTFRYNFTNEGGYGRNIRFLKNIMGLWIIQECRRQWDGGNESLSFDLLTQEASASRAFEFMFNPDSDILLSPGDMEGRVRKLCMERGGRAPEARGQITRAIYENLAFYYRKTLEHIEEITGRHFSTINVVGGGSRDELLMQFTANATGKIVAAGPAEATALGNIAVQLISAGELSSIKDARRVISASFDLKYYYPREYELWNEIYQSRRDIYE